MNRLLHCRAILIFILSVIIFHSCSETGDVGMELLPNSDLFVVGNKVEHRAIRAYTFIDDSVRTDEPSVSLLGSYNDPVFGKTTIDFATQLRLSSFPDFGNNAVADSIKFFFYYYTIFGDTTTVQKIRIYELNQSLDPDARYYEDTDLSAYSSSVPLAEYNFKPKVQLDSVYKDTTYQLVSITLDKSLANKLIAADSADMVNNEVFLDYFKGLYLQSETTAQGGAIVSLELIPTSEFPGSAMVLYYHNDTDTTSQAYYITSFSARVNSYRHDYSQTAFYQNLNKESAMDSLLYIQSTGGLQSKIYIPGLENWRDSSRIAINKAELIFHVDTTASDFRKYPLPDQLLLTYIDDNGNEILPQDHAFYSLYYGGYLQADFTYKFNITQHLQSILTRKSDGSGYINNNNGFFLTPFNKNNQMRRAVLKGSTSAKGIRFVVTYTKLLQ